MTGPLRDDDIAAFLADLGVPGIADPNIPFAEQVCAVASWAAADDRLGAAFLRSVLHDAPARLLYPAV